MFTPNSISQVIVFTVCVCASFCVYHVSLQCILAAIRFPQSDSTLCDHPALVGIRMLGGGAVLLLIHVFCPTSFTLSFACANILMSALNIVLGLHIRRLQTAQRVKWSDKEKVDFITYMFYCIGFPMVNLIFYIVALLILEL